MIDGWDHLAKDMSNVCGSLRLRPARDADEAILLRWANDPLVRAHSFSPSVITSDEHRRWFHSVLSDQNRLLLIAMHPNGSPIGQIRFDRQPVSNQFGLTEVLVDISLDPFARGYGYSVQLVRLGIQFLERKWGSQFLVVAVVFCKNAASNSCFARAGLFLIIRVSVANDSRHVNYWCFSLVP